MNLNNKIGKVVKLFYSTDGNRVSIPELSLDNKGVIKDKYYDKDIQRSVLIASLDSYKLAANHDIDIPYGFLGENILIDYNPYHLNVGTRFYIGDLILEISQNCTICKGLASIDKKLPKLLKNDRGIFAKIISIGTIKVDDSIFLIDK
jgi:MOSC domain-containing protein YiiM